MNFKFKYKFDIPYFSCFTRIAAYLFIIICFLWLLIDVFVNKSGIPLVAILLYIIFLSVSSVMPLRAIDIILWGTKGYEEITITDDLIIIEKKNKLFCFKKKIKIKNLINIIVEEDKRYCFLRPNAYETILDKGTLKFYAKKRLLPVKAGLNMPLEDGKKMRIEILRAVIARGA